MNKRKLQEFATWSKENLEKQIELSLKKIGIHSSDNIKQSRVQGDITIIDGVETTFDKSFKRHRDEIINKIKTDGYKHSIEQFASTWFNRIVALRFMEVHDYLDHGFKIFPNEQNTLPEILTKLTLVSDELNLDMEYCHSLLDSGNNNEELYRYILFQQSNALAKSLPMLFSHSMEYLEYFIPTPLLFGDTIINRLIEIDEDDFKEDVEIIGWLYQFYIATKKDEVFASKKTITKDTLPAVTQLFTPDWIVRYMAENSVGRIWLESYPQSGLKEKMKYFVEEAEQESEVIKQLEAIKYKNVNPEQIRIIEPACGSGHILVYVFELLFEMYLEKGYLRKDIPQLILKNNIFGLDIDQRASQLSSFALAMKARSIDNKFFDKDRNVKPRVYEIIDSKSILSNRYNGKSYLEILKDYNNNQWKGETHLADEEIQSIKYIVELFEDAKVIGSLLKVKPNKYLSLRKKLALNVIKHTQADIFTSAFFEYEFKELLEILRIAHVMSTQYDVMITNPPYLGISSLEKKPKSYFSKFYPNSKKDMFTMFMDTNLIIKGGFLSMINMHSWMFLSSFEKLRSEILKNKTFISMVHLGARAFETISGEVVQTVSFIYRNIILNFKTKVHRLINFDYIEKEKHFILKDNIYTINFEIYKNIPSLLFAYWLSPKLFSNFIENEKLQSYGDAKQGLATSDNNRFLRYWYEVNLENVDFEINEVNETSNSSCKWFPYSKAGMFRRWSNNNELVVNYKSNGKEIKESVMSKYPYLKTPDFVVKNTNTYFKEGITWNDVSTGMFCARYVPTGQIYDASSPMYFPYREEDLLILLGYFNSKVFQVFADIICQGLHYSTGHIPNIPFKSTRNKIDIKNIVANNIHLSKIEWDSYETSWDFKKHPLLGGTNLNEQFNNFKSLTKSNFITLKNNEEKLNEYFINLYGLKDELSKDVEENYISISIADKTRDIKSLISYLIGVLMGRYSLAEEGLIYAGGTFDSSRYGNYDVDEDGIIPIFPDLSFENGLVHRIIGLIKDVYGEEYYRDNIDFIADALGKKANETSEETLNRYLNNDFYSDHLKTYKKRPIYWMFSSGKKNGFKALIYLHRYNSNTLAKMNAGYFQPATTVLRTRISEVEKLINTASDREKVQLERTRFSLVEQLNEAIEYGQVLDYMANKYISIDLDEGVKENYKKFQKIEINTSHGKVKKDLLIPIK